MTQQVPLSAIRPNPYRNIERYPYDEAKIAALRESIGETGFWDNVLARRASDGQGSLLYEIAFGHHRVEAMRRDHEEYKRLHPHEVVPEPEVGLIIRTLSDEDMIKIMARENMQEWGTSATVEMETVRAVVTAFASGAVTLAAPDIKTPAAQLRHAPGFAIGSDPGTSPGHPYTAATVAPFLGWTVEKVQDTLAALEMVEASILCDSDYVGLSTSQARAMTAQARQIRESFRQRARQQEAESEEASREAARARQAEDEARREQEQARQRAIAERDEQLRQAAQRAEDRAREAYEAAMAARQDAEHRQQESAAAATQTRTEGQSRAGAAARAAGDQMRSGASVREISRKPAPAPEPEPSAEDLAMQAGRMLQQMLKDSDIAVLLRQLAANRSLVSPECRNFVSGALMALADDARAWQGKLMAQDVPVNA